MLEPDHGIANCYRNRSLPKELTLMCARYVITSPAAAIRALFGYAERPDFPPRYNVAPTQPIPVVRLDAGKRTFALLRWGFVPAWVKDPRNFSLLVNARGESVLDKPSFRNAMRRRRCLIPADGFYEWSDGTPRRPYFVRAKIRRTDRLCRTVGDLDRSERRGDRLPRRSSPRRQTARWRAIQAVCRSSSRRRHSTSGSIAPKSTPRPPRR